MRTISVVREISRPIWQGGEVGAALASRPDHVGTTSMSQPVKESFDGKSWTGQPWCNVFQDSSNRPECVISYPRMLYRPRLDDHGPGHGIAAYSRSPTTPTRVALRGSTTQSISSLHGNDLIAFVDHTTGSPEISRRLAGRLFSACATRVGASSRSPTKAATSRCASCRSPIYPPMTAVATGHVCTAKFGLRGGPARG